MITIAYLTHLGKVTPPICKIVLARNAKHRFVLVEILGSGNDFWHVIKSDVYAVMLKSICTNICVSVPLK